MKVAKVLKNSVKEVTCKRKGGKKSMHFDFYKLCKKIEFLSEPKNVECEKKETGVEYVEVYNSFRPSVCAAISEQIEVLSDSENEHEVAVECKTSLVNGGTNNFHEKLINTNLGLHETSQNLYHIIQ